MKFTHVPPKAQHLNRHQQEVLTLGKSELIKLKHATEQAWQTPQGEKSETVLNTIRRKGLEWSRKSFATAKKQEVVEDVETKAQEQLAARHQLDTLVVKGPRFEKIRELHAY